MSTSSAQTYSGRPNDGAGPRKVLRLIETLCHAQEPLRLADLAAGAAVSKPTAHRLLGTLVAEGWAVAHPGGRYGIGPTASGVGAAVARGHRHTTVEAVLVELQDRIGQTIHVGLRSGDRIVYTHKVEGVQPFAFLSRVGMQQPLHSTAIGKCILAGLDAAALAELVDRTGLERRTDRTLTTLDALSAELAGVRERGYALDDEENEPNVRCLAAPVHTPDGRTVGAVSVSTVTFIIGRDEVLALTDAVRDTARRVESVMA
ncbi:IclR family transcriptional regulator [Streptomyces sp. NPDC053560]|uniref:IclR family transcriptional regulator n=1 Tax=Streptomyces sp. NPDC053560 TaxID=3365711 RepID=UPI0037D6708A